MIPHPPKSGPRPPLSPTPPPAYSLLPSHIDTQTHARPHTCSRGLPMGSLPMTPSMPARFSLTRGRSEFAETVHSCSTSAPERACVVGNARRQGVGRNRKEASGITSNGVEYIHKPTSLRICITFRRGRIREQLRADTGNSGAFSSANRNHYNRKSSTQIPTMFSLRALFSATRRSNDHMVLVTCSRKSGHQPSIPVRKRREARRSE